MTNRFTNDTIDYNYKRYKLSIEGTWPYTITEMEYKSEYTIIKEVDIINLDPILSSKVIEFYIDNIYSFHSFCMTRKEKNIIFIQKFLAKVKRINIDIIYMLLTSDIKEVRNLVRGYL